MKIRLLKNTMFAVMLAAVLVCTGCKTEKEVFFGDNDKVIAAGMTGVLESIQAQTEQVSEESSTEEVTETAEDTKPVETETVLQTQAEEVKTEKPTSAPAQTAQSNEGNAAANSPAAGGNIDYTVGTGRVITIDAGHQGKGNYEKEPLGPGSSELKAKVTSGTSGCVTGIDEYVFTLDLSLMLQKELEARGYQVIMVRSTHDVNISNAERAAVANDANSDAFIRIHANSSSNASAKGALTICQTSGNPYNGAIYSQSRKLSDCVLNGLISATGCNKRSVWETDTMSGINWCKVPVTIVEVGFMSNPEEDRLMATQEYRQKLVLGIANGIDKYISER